MLPNRNVFTCAVALLASLLLLASGPRTAAEDGRDFAGFYQVGEDVTDLGEDVRVTLTVRIHNYSGADVIGAKIILEDSLLPAEDLGTFAAIVDIRYRESARASEPFTVPLRLYDQWQEGVPPHLRLEFTDAAGTKQRAPVELGPMLVDEEVQ